MQSFHLRLKKLPMNWWNKKRKYSEVQKVATNCKVNSGNWSMVSYFLTVDVWIHLTKTTLMWMFVIVVIEFPCFVGGLFMRPMLVRNLVHVVSVIKCVNLYPPSWAHFGWCFSFLDSHLKHVTCSVSSLLKWGSRAAVDSWVCQIGMSQSQSIDCWVPTFLRRQEKTYQIWRSYLVCRL